MAQFLGNVNMFEARAGEAHAGPGYVRPHELEIVAEPGPDTWAVTLHRTLTVGPNTRLEFRRGPEDAPVDVELPRERFTVLRERLGLVPGVRLHLRPRRVTRFGAPQLGAPALI